MSRLYIADTSLRCPDEHNYQYDLHVARSADEVGLKPVLAAHVDFPADPEFEERWPCVRVFTQAIPYKLATAIDRSRPAVTDPKTDLDTLSASERELRSRVAHYGDALIAGLEQLFTAHPPADGDRVFLPTITHVDLPALRDFWKGHPEWCHIDWHVQLHIPFLSGRRAGYAEQQPIIERVAGLLRDAIAQIPEGRVFWHATVAELAEQYELTGAAKFHFTPYPINPDVAPRPDRENQPIRLVFAGRMRGEKGRGTLQRLLRTLAKRHRRDNQVEVHVQRKRRPYRDALRNLLRLDPASGNDVVKYAEFPLPTEAYTEFIRNADVGILPYDGERYHARCSGVFLEMLQAGVPVVVPAGSWMSEQLEDVTDEHLRTIENGIKDLSPTTTREALLLSLDASSIPTDSPADTGALFVRWTWDSLDGRSHLKFRLRSTSGTNILDEVVIRSRPDAATGRVLLKVPASAAGRDLHVECSTIWQTERVGITDLTVTPIPGERGRSLPRGVAGVVCSDLDRISEAIDEAVTFFAHYRRTALAYAPLVATEHHPARVVESILTRRRAAA